MEGDNVSQGTTAEMVLRGIPASPGLAIGPAVLLQEGRVKVPRWKIRPEEIRGELERLQAALLETRRELLEAKAKLAENESQGAASVLDVHLMVLEDPAILEALKARLEEKLYNVEYVYHEITEEFSQHLLALNEDYFRERASDIRDVARRVLAHCQGNPSLARWQLEEPSILAARSLYLSDVVALDRRALLGLITEEGTRTSHAAILARSLNIPAVVGLGGLLKHLNDQVEILVDGVEGWVVIRPSESTKRRLLERQMRRNHLEARLNLSRDLTAVTRDGRHITVSANVELPDDIPLVRANGAEGIGLLRTEFLFLNRATPPSEEEQCAAYREIAQAVKPHGVIIRTLDLGADKLGPLLPNPVREANPFLGWRGIRLSLDCRNLFQTQLRAIWRAGTEGNVRVMFPMVTTLEELRLAKELFWQCRQQLCEEGVPVPEQIECGVMVEVPSVALLADLFAREVDFFSVGTNDLVQYTLAVDRLNGKVSALYQPTHPSVLRLLHRVVEEAHRFHIWVGVCGEMAADLFSALALVALGVDELSMGSVFVPWIKDAIRHVHYGELRKHVDELTQCPTSGDVLERLRELAQLYFPHLLEEENQWEAGGLSPSIPGT